MSHDKLYATFGAPPRLTTVSVCPSTETIAEYVCRTLAPPHLEAVEWHVADCASCRQVIGTLAASSVARIAAGSVDDALPRPPGTASAPASESRYVIRQELARGGMGRISIADDTLLGRRVAIKEPIAATTTLAAHFARELALTSRLQHPSIVSIHDGGHWPSGEPFYVMRLINGEPLDRAITRNASLASRIGLLPHAIAAVDALAYAHSQGVVHRDLKPANILIGDYGETVVIDWGLALDLRDPGDEPKQVVGTPGYLAPEQARGEATDERADVYSLGAVLHHLFVGALPYPGKRATSIVRAVASSSVDPLAALPPELPADLRAIVAKAMAPRRDDRYATASELAADLKRFERGQLVGAQRYSSWQLARRWVRRHRAAVAVGGVAVAVVAAIATASVRYIIAERRVAEHNRADAEELMSFMLTDLREKLQPIGKLDLLRTVADKARAYYRERPDEHTADARAKQVLAHENLGRVLAGQGELAGALVEYRDALRLADELAAEAPGDAEHAHQQSVAHRLVGDALEHGGDTTSALAEQQAALAIAERVFVMNPANAQAIDDQIESRLALGGLLEQRGESAVAIAEQRTATALAEQLEARAPTVDHEHVLFTCYGKLGRSLDDHGVAGEALASYRRAEALASARVARAPADSDAQHDLSRTEDDIGALLAADGDLAGALTELRAAVAIAARLAALDATNVSWQRELAGHEADLGNALLSSGDARGAIAAFERSRLAMRELVTRAPDADNQRGLEVATVLVGDGREAAGDLDAAVDEYRGALAIAEPLGARDPSSTSTQYDITRLRRVLGETLAAHGDATAALPELRAADELAARLVAQDGADATFRRLHYSTLSSLGELLQVTDPAAAIDAQRQALAIATSLAGAPDAGDYARADLCEGHLGLSHALLANGRGEATEAIAKARAGLAIANELAARSPSSATWQDLIVRARLRLGDALRAGGDEHGAVAEYQGALAVAVERAGHDAGNHAAAATVATLRERLARHP